MKHRILRGGQARDGARESLVEVGPNRPALSDRVSQEVKYGLLREGRVREPDSVNADEVSYIDFERLRDARSKYLDWGAVARRDVHASRSELIRLAEDRVHCVNYRKTAHRLTLSSCQSICRFSE
jgi:hypothetical protein